MFINTRGEKFFTHEMINKHLSLVKTCVDTKKYRHMYYET